MRAVLTYMAVWGTQFALYLALLPLLTRTFTAEQFGSFALIRVCLPVLHHLGNLGSSEGALRYGSEAQRTDAHRIAATLVWSRMLVAAVIGGVLWVAGSLVPLDAVLEVEDVGAVLWKTLLTFWLMTVGQAVLTTLRARQRHGPVALSQGVGLLVEVSLILLWVIARDGGVEALISAWLVGEVARLLLVLPVAWQWTAHAPSAELYRKLVRFGFAATFREAAMSAANLDRFVISGMLSLGTAASYELAGAPGSIIMILERSGWAVYQPKIYSSAEERTEHKLDRFVRLFAGTLCLAALGITALAPELFAFFAPDYGGIVPLVPWLVFTGVCESLFAVFGIGAGIAKRTRPWLVASGSYLVATFALVASGAALGSAEAAAMRFVAALVGTLLSYHLARRVWPVRLPVHRAAVAIGVGAGGMSLLLGWFSATTPVAIAWRLGGVAVLMLLTVAVLAPRRAPRGE